MTEKLKKKKAKSPYQKYGKTPFRYSDIYYKWRTAIINGNDGLAARLSREHAERFA